jgi:hypothetical protein
MTADIRLFSYGTLQQREVQLATYGRPLDGSADALTGYRLVPLKIDDPHVVRLSGRKVHQIARATGDAADRIEGIVFLLTEAELRQSDDYEVSAYTRIEVALESGQTAYVYAGPPAASATRQQIAR